MIESTTTTTKNNRSKLASSLIIVGYILLMIASALLFSSYVDKDSLQEIVRSSGQWGLAVYFLIEVVYVTFTPLLNTFILIVSGYLFGGTTGFILNFLSTTVGLFLIVFLVRKYGRPVLHRVVSPRFYRRFDDIIQKVGPVTLLVVYVLPFTPDDELTYIIAAGPLGFKRFILPVVLGTIAEAAYSYIGDMGTQGIAIAGYARIALLIIGLTVVGLQEYFIKKHARTRLPQQMVV